MSIEDIISAADKVIGYKQVLRGLREGTVNAVALSADTEPQMIAAIENECARVGAVIIRAMSRVHLGHLCGIDVGCAVAGSKIE